MPFHLLQLREVPGGHRIPDSELEAAVAPLVEAVARLEQVVREVPTRHIVLKTSSIELFLIYNKDQVKVNKIHSVKFVLILFPNFKLLHNLCIIR